MAVFPCTTAIVRFPRRNPLSLLVLLIPISLLLYTYFGDLHSWAANKIVAIDPNVLPPVQHTVPSNTSHASDTSDILLISAFFPFSKSKYSFQQYSTSIARFLSTIKTDVYFYTTADFEPTIREIRGALPITINTTYTSGFDIPPLQGRETDYTRMHEEARGRNRGSPDIYAVRNAKPFLLAEAVRTLAAATPAKNYKYAFWADAESFGKTHVFSNWPDLERVEEVWEAGREESGRGAEDLIFFPMQYLPVVSMVLWNENMGPIQNDFSQGSFFGGHESTIFWWEKYYYAYHNYYLSQHVFIGRDQALVNSLVLLHPERIITVFHADPEAPAALYSPAETTPESLKQILGDCGDPSSYYQFFLASEHERDVMRRVWDSAWHLDFWHAAWWTRRRTTCRLTHVLAMERLLKRPFGETWHPPQATVSF